MPRCAVLLLSALLFAGRVPAQSFTTGPCGGDEGNSNGWFGHESRVCELRSVTLPLVNGQLSVSGKNGGIEVVGEERQDIALNARFTAQDSSREEAESLLKEVKIVTNGSIQAEGPQNWGFSHRSWSVNWSLRVPRHVNAELHTMNGGIKVTNVIGVLNVDTTNGGLTLDDLAGNVHATTVNGGLDVKLDGNQWHGAGTGCEVDQWRRYGEGSRSVFCAPGRADGQWRDFRGLSDHHSGQDRSSDRHQYWAGRGDASFPDGEWRGLDPSDSSDLAELVDLCAAKDKA